MNISISKQLGDCDRDTVVEKSVRIESGDSDEV
jgi:hypothetical protein